MDKLRARTRTVGGAGGRPPEGMSQAIVPPHLLGGGAGLVARNTERTRIFTLWAPSLVSLSGPAIRRRKGVPNSRVTSWDFKGESFIFPLPLLLLENEFDKNRSLS